MAPKQKSLPPVEPRSSTRNRIANIRLRDPNNVDVGKAPASLIPKKTSAKISTSKEVDVPASQAAGSKRKQSLTEVATNSEIEEVLPSPKKSKKKYILLLILIHSQELAPTEDVDKERFLKDLTGLDKRGDLPAEGKTMDVNHFFDKPCKDIKDNSHRKSTLVPDVTTLRRHMQSTHKDAYLKWVKATPGAVNKLPEFITQQQKEAEKLQERVIPYSDELFKQAAVEWLIATDQPIQALEHPKFQEMIDIPS
ncbi:hypothetical protein M422DRAFT_272626 [Sphaerobolus stellatus SS14]|uniref:Uncharacterized protein n=1 Tax=Sphaerobolus stellatus (strain SS14) TaxID=990650 RepID=A0A0C9TWZ5_SPHS4|nr:hypothetical protein M422DRAFT_272626 [Sphaerobolus stellatus SS14]